MSKRENIRKILRERFNQLFVRYPSVGQFGYDFIRITKIDRSTHGVKRYLKKLQSRGFHPHSVLDVGANYGAWSQIASAVFSDAKFYLIEPQVEMKPFLDRFCAGRPEARWFQAGAGAEVGELALTAWDDFAGSSFLPSPPTPAQTQRRVPVITIDSLVNQEEIILPKLVKIDVQGFELEVLKGANCCFGVTELFIIEVSFFKTTPDHPIFHDVVHFMSQRDYVVYDFVDLKYRPFDGALGQADVCFVKRDGLFTKYKRWY